MTNYIFRVRGQPHIITIPSTTFSGALDRILEKYPAKFVVTKYAKNMELLKAREEAKKLSKGGKKVYIVVDEKNGDCEVGSAPLRGSLYRYINGKEDEDFVPSTASIEVAKKVSQGKLKEQIKSGKLKPLKSKTDSAEKESTNNQNNKIMSKESKKPAKKEAPKKSAKSEKDWGKVVNLTNAQMTAKIKKGYVYRDPKGVNKTKYIPERPNQEAKMEGYYEQAPSTK